MRIAFLSRVFIFGGAEMSNIELARRMSKFHNIKFFDIYGNTPTYLTSLKEGKLPFTILQNDSSGFIVNKYKNIILNAFRYLMYIPKWFSIKGVVRAELEKYRPDVVIVYDQLCLSYLPSFRNRDYKVMYFIRTWAAIGQIPRFTAYLLKKNVDKLICVSEATRHALYCTGIAPLDKLYVVHNSVNEKDLTIETEELKVKKGKSKIIHSGGFLPSKGQHVALEALKILREREINCHLFLCGIIYPGKGEFSRKYLNGLEEYVMKNNLEEHVTFVVGLNNIISYMRASDILFFPSASEGLPRSVMEAMLLGKPVVSNAVGGVTDLIIDRYTGFITKYNNANDYANAAQLLIKDTNLYNRIAQNAYTMVKTTFNEEAQIAKMNQLLS